MIQEVWDLETLTVVLLGTLAACFLELSSGEVKGAFLKGVSLGEDRVVLLESLLWNLEGIRNYLRCKLFAWKGNILT